MTATPAAAWAQLVASLAAADAGLRDPARGSEDPVDRAEGYQGLTALLAAALEVYVTADPLRPAWWRMVTPTRKYLGDNTDSRYDLVQIDPTRTYRITGVRGDDCYLAFCVYRGPDDGHWSTGIAANVHHRDLGVAPGERFELVLSPDPDPDPDPEPAGGRGGPPRRWIQLPADATTVICRQYFWDPAHARPATLAVELVGEPVGPPPPLTPAAIAAKLAAAAHFLDDSVAVVPLGLPPANSLLPPFAFLEGSPGWGTPDNIYALGCFDLGPDEALVLRGRSPAAAYWGLQLWNSMMQSLDGVHHRVSINAAQVTLGADGGWEVWVAGRDPGHPNWIDTVGHRTGIVFCRWLLAESFPEAPTAELVALPPR